MQGTCETTKRTIFVKPRTQRLSILQLPQLSEPCISSQNACRLLSQRFHVHPLVCVGAVTVVQQQHIAPYTSSLLVLLRITQRTNNINNLWDKTTKSNKRFHAMRGGTVGTPMISIVHICFLFLLAERSLATGEGHAHPRNTALLVPLTQTKATLQPKDKPVRNHCDGGVARTAWPACG